MEQSPQPIYCFSSKLESRETFTRIGFLIILFIFMVSSGVSNGAGTNFWVSAGTGLDTNPGTHDLPFKTIQKGVDNALPGSVIHIMAGTYVEQVNITSSGSQGAGHIVLKGEIGNPPVIDGTTL
ncbi:MAG: DUF1565 domain-containing protein, partial [Desulfobacteraceae bacterium]|nr:DUF1565 domain-containing protein [Desulfobacteraceae bacterium]